MAENAAYVEVLEQDQMGRVIKTRLHQHSSRRQAEKLTHTLEDSNTIRILELCSKLFMPAGYPETVSPDYLQFQILNALQAFCSSLASLLSSRAVLEGFGVGDASATATHALLLTVVQDFFSRITTIIGAYYLGSSLFPEAKMYRMLADILFDFAIVLDTLSPLLNSGTVPGLRIAALCLSGSLRALCGICAGGARTALTVHFANPAQGAGDVGDLNAKQSSQETVLSLCGMLLGTLVVPLLTTPQLTYSVLSLVICLHLVINYAGVRGIVLRSLNRQRLGILWATYRHEATILSPLEVSRKERVFERSGSIRSEAGHTIGHCTIGSSFSDIGPHCVLEPIETEQYIIWADLGTRSGDSNLPFPRIHLALRESHTSTDHLRGWTHALEVARSFAAEDVADASCILRDAYQQMNEYFPGFLQGLRKHDWNMSDVSLLTGAPMSLVTSVVVAKEDHGGQWEVKKDR